MDKIDTGLLESPLIKKDSWCYKDQHQKFEKFTDFNDWLDSDDGFNLRERYGIEGLLQPSKAFYASDKEAYNQAFKEYRNTRRNEVLNKTYLCEQFADEHWFERNVKRFDQLVNCLEDGSVVPFIGAGISVEGGFPTWKNHLRQQGRTAGINPKHIESLLSMGKFEKVIEEIEDKRGRDVFIQEIRDVFSTTGSITDTSLRITELFSDTVITTNYDHLLELSFETGVSNSIQIINGDDTSHDPDPKKITIVKLHGDIKTPSKCVLSKCQYDQAYGKKKIDLTLPIPKILSYHYKNSSLLFLGCSLNNDRTMRVFEEMKKNMGDVDKPQHFSLEQVPQSEKEVVDRNAYLLKFGITPIWFEKGRFEYIESMLRLARNELNYRRIP
ncbi:MAG: SIR2 family protein [Ignavibacteriales bacterium]|nr:SIR2 family protein [Ignavibacteriales bacterium]